MKIAFVNDWSQQIALQYIFAVLKKHGYDVKLFTEPNLFDDIWISIPPLHKILDFREEVVRKLKLYNPDLIGISATTRTYDWACYVAESIKKHMDVPIIAGGLHPTFVPERVIENPCYDMLCVGEGEYPLLELVHSMEKGTVDYSIKNIWFKKDGKVIKNDIRPLIEDIDSIPNPDMDVYLDSYSYHTNSYVMSTLRGCPFSCSYCCTSYYHQLYKLKGPRFRVRSVENVIKELLEVKRLNKRTRKIMFNDTCFGFNIKWLKEFSKEYAQKINIGFFCVMHPASITEESIGYLKAARCRCVSLGMQSWEEDVRVNLYNRRVSNEVMERAVQLIKKAKMEVLLDNIYGHPGSDPEKYIQSLDFYTRCKPTRNYFYRLHHFPKTVLTEKAYANKWLSHGQYENALDGKDLGTLRYEPAQDGSCAPQEKIYKQMQLLFILIDLVPARVTYYIIKKRWYRFFPAFLNSALLTICRTLISFDLESCYFRSIMFTRYFYFIKRKILSHLRLKK